MPAEYTYDYAIIRVVPRVDRGEQINVGVILSCADTDFLDARIEVDESLLRAVDPEVDLDAVRANLAVIPAVCRGGPEAGPIGALPLAWPLPMAGRAAQHDYPAVRCAHRADERPGSLSRALDGPCRAAATLERARRRCSRGWPLMTPMRGADCDKVTAG